jgi:hypothetical protein
MSFLTMLFGREYGRGNRHWLDGVGTAAMLFDIRA